MSRSNLARLALIRGNICDDHGATVGEDFISKFGDAPGDGENDALSDQNTEDISSNLAAILIWVKELVGCVKERNQHGRDESGE